MKIKGFTLVETLIVIIMIGLLSMSMMTYLGGNDERVLRYKAEWCVKTINGKLQNFLNFALTSKSFTLSGALFSPDYYVLWFSWMTVSWFDHFVLNGITLSWDNKLLEKVSKSDCTNELDKELRFVVTWSQFSWVFMSKWFRQITPKDRFIFVLTWWNSYPFTGEVLVKLCETDECKKDIAKWVFDTRVQSIFLKMCLFYKEESLDECGERES